MDFEFRELVDVGRLQELTDELYKATGIPSAIIDMRGDILTGSGWQRICTDFHRKHPEIERQCIESDVRIRQRLDAGDCVVVYRCPRGLVDASSPVIIEGKHVANVFVGQLFTEPPDAATEQAFREQARQFGFDEEEYMKAYREIPVMPVEQFRGALSFMAKLARLVADLGLTRKRELEAAAQQQARERQFRHLVESTRMVPWELDLATERFTYMGPQAEKVLGRPADYWRDMESWANAVHEDDRERAVNFCRLETQANRDHAFEYRIRTPDGQVRWIHDVVSVISGPHGPERLAGFMLDITQRKRDEIALKESREWYQTLFDGSPEGILVAEAATRRFLFANARACQMFGYSESEMLQMAVADISPAESRARVEAEFAEQAAGLKILAQALPCLRKDGSQFFADVAAARLRVAGRECVVGFFSDVTARLQAETQLRESEAQLRGLLEQSEKSRRALLSLAEDQQKSEKALRESEEKHRALIENIPDVVMRFDRDGRNLFVSDNVEQAVGLPADRFLGKTHRELGFPDDLCDFWENAIRQTFDSGKTTETEFTFEGPRGPVIFNWRLVPEFDRDGRVRSILSLSRNVTAQRKAEETIRAMAEMLDIAPNAIVVHGFDGRFLYANRKTFEMHGWQSEEFMALNLHQVDVPESEALIEERMAIIRDKGEAAFEVTHYRKDGTTFPLSIYVKTVAWSGQPAILAVWTDITERKRAESERERLTAAIEQAAEVVVITDADARIQYVNPAFEKVTGYTREEVLGQNPRILKSGRQDDVFYQDMWRALSSGRPWEGRMVNRRKDGTLYTEEATISPVRDASGRIVNYVGVKRDISHELDLEQQYRQAQKMEAIGQLTGGVAHDFNNLLQVINGYTDMAMSDLPGDHPVRAHLRQVAAAGDRAARLVGQLLAFSRRQVMRPEDIDINEVAGNLMKMLQRVIGEHIRVDFIPARHLGLVRADRGMIEQIIMNLSVNARDAMPAAGDLIIETQNVLINSDYCATHAWAKPGRFALLSVTDTGCGMDKEILEHIFEPFFTTKEIGKGTGLGLATVYGIVRQHDGMIHVYSEPDKGSTFKVYLPLSERPADVVGNLIEGAATGGRETILLAEDDDMVRDLAVRFLEQAGYSVIAARNGAEAVALFERHDNAIDLALLDVVMPEMGGREAHEKMRARRPDLKVLFASGYSENAIHTNFVLHSGVTLLQKPYARAALLRAVRGVLDGDPNPPADSAP